MSRKNGVHLIPFPRKIDWLGNPSEIPVSAINTLGITKSGLVALPSFIVRETLSNAENSQAYFLEIGLKQIRISADTDQAVFLALQTLRQIARQAEAKLPQVSIHDHPDFLNRGFMLDVSRDKVPKMEVILEHIDRAASLKFTQFQLYSEHTFAYKNHETVWADASPVTPDEIHQLDVYCEERFIELIPNQNTFGHMSRWLIHEPYRHLAEQPNGGETDWGFRKEPQSLCPIDPGSLDLVEDLFDHLLPHFQSKQVNIGCDETIDLGFGRSKEEVEKKGRGRVYLEYLQKIIKLCKDRGYHVQFWADIILKYPDLVSELPTGCTAMNWGYEANHPFEEETLALKNSGVPFYVCPGTSSWCSIAGRTDNMIENIESAARHGLNNGAEGFLLTDWGDYGHWQMDTITLPGFYFAAAVGWNGSADNKGNLPDVLDCLEFHSPGWGKLILDLGNADNFTGLKFHNQSLLFKLLQLSDDEILAIEGLDKSALESTLDQILSLKEQFEKLSNVNSELSCGDEMAWTLKMLQLACNRGLQLLGNDLAGATVAETAKELQKEQECLWHMKNRPGGYLQSRSYFAKIMGA